MTTINVTTNPVVIQVESNPVQVTTATPAAIVPTSVAGVVVSLPSHVVRIAQSIVSPALPVDEAYTYDGDGRLITISSVIGTESLTYDPDGRVATKTDTARGVVTTYTYDVDGRLQSTEVTPTT